ncbi:MAG: hypothetical protein GX781_07740, partial [Clostridiales bacterium]|nr:hypothetical protein [Clostridiales bacterium]
MYKINKLTAILAVLVLLSASLVTPALAWQTTPDNDPSGAVGNLGKVSFRGHFELTITCPEGSLGMTFSKNDDAPNEFAWRLSLNDDSINGTWPPEGTAAAYAGQGIGFDTAPVITPDREQAADDNASIYVMDFVSDIPGSTATILFEDRYF